MWYIIFTLFLFYLFLRFTLGITRSATCLVGKTVILTGGNSGIGYHAALNLASRGCKLIIADVADLTETKKKIIEYTNNPNIVTKFLDLGSLQSVRDFASDIIKTEERIDILINNAGIGLSKENRTADGFHPVTQVNYLGPFLLTHLLINLLKKSAPSRTVFTSSALAFFHHLSLDNLNFNDKSGSFFSKVQCYCNSKVALLMASDVFAEKLQGSGVTSNSIHPGFVSTPIMGKVYNVLDNACYIFLNSMLKLCMFVYSKDQWEGSQNLVHVAVSKKLEKVTGKYFWDCRPFMKPRVAYDRGFREKIWNATEKMVGLKPEKKI